jgi:hypothetical protein
MLKLQGGKCAICDAEIRLGFRSYSGVIDHSHKTGKVRAILCWGCNVRLGKLEATFESEWYKRTKVYLERAKVVPLAINVHAAEAAQPFRRRL